jgi:hypothetical protein
MMSDWLSKVEEQRRRETAANDAKAEKEQRALNENYNRTQRSYQQNKNRYDEIFDSIEKYTNRASGLGFDVITKREGIYMSIERFYFDGEGKVGRELELRPWDNGFLVSYGYGNRTTYINLHRVTDGVIADWVKWAAGHGPSDPIGERRLNLIFMIIGLIVGLIVVGMLAYNFMTVRKGL